MLANNKKLLFHLFVFFAFFVFFLMADAWYDEIDLQVFLKLDKIVNEWLLEIPPFPCLD